MWWIRPVGSEPRVSAPVESGPPFYPHDYRKLAAMPRVGFWYPADPSYYEPGDPELALPRVASAVDLSWGGESREIVLAHVRLGDVAASCRGWSDCRLCGKRNGSQDFTDGRYVWPSGFDHYISEHGVRPPREFVAHCVRVARGA